MGVPASSPAPIAAAPFEVEVLDQGAPKKRLPLVLICALALWAASAAVFFASPFPDGPSCAMAALACCIAAGALCIAGVRLRRHASLFVVAFACLGCALGSCAISQMLAGYALADASAHVTSLSCIQDSSKSDYGFSTLCEAWGKEGRLGKVRLFSEGDAGFLSGDELLCDACLSPLKEEARAFYRTQGICAQVSATDLAMKPPEGPLGALRGMRQRAIELICEHGGQEAPLFCAIVCGFRQDMAQSALYDRFKTCGLAHIVAVSGAHASIVLMLILALMSALRAPRAITIAISVLFVGAYVVFAGLPISAVRATIMSILALTSYFAHRRSATLASIGLCVLAFLIADPLSCLSVSLFLSVASTLGIVLFAALISSWFLPTPERVRTSIIEPVSLTLSSNLVTLPFSAALFSQLSLIAPVANVLAAPAFTLACAAGLASCILAVMIAPLAGLLIHIASFAMMPLSFLASALSSVPFASIACSLDPVPMLIATAILCAWLLHAWPRFTRRAIVICMGLFAAIFVLGSLFAVHLRGDEVSALDVGQGDAILIRSGAANVLIDTGNSDSMLREALGEAGIFHLDAVIVTHPDDDHCASLASLGSYVQVDRICFAEDVASCGCAKCERLLSLADECAPAAEREWLSVGDELHVGSFALKVVWPDGFSDEGGNADSVCLLGELDCDEDGVIDWRALFTGDAESEELDQMLKEGRVGDIDLLKVGHHGSKVSLTEEDVAKISPEVALISVGANNRYGHPTEEVLTCLASVGCEVFRTDERGTITVSFTKDAMRVSP